MIDNMVSDSFFLEDVEDPIATNMFVNSSLYELLNDDVVGDSLFRHSSDGEDDYANTFFDDCMTGCSISLIDTEVDKDLSVDNNIDDEDGEIIDMLDGLV